MKKIFLSAVIALGLLVAATTATYAVWSSSKTLENNTLAAATIGIDLDGLVHKPINATNMLPGQWSDWGKIAVWNKSTVGLKAYFYVDNFEGDCGKTWLELRTGWAGGNEKQFLVYEGYLIGVQGPAHRVQLTALGIDPNFMNPVIPAGWHQVTWQQAKLHESADISYQNTSCTWDEVFVGETYLP